MTASQIPDAADLGRPKQRLYSLLQERHQRITNRILGQSLREVDTAVAMFANELADGFKAVFKAPERKTTSGSYITLFWKDSTEVIVKLDGHTEQRWDHNRAPWLQCQKVNDHRRRLQLRKRETPQQIVIRVIDHFRNTDSELSTVLSWKVRGDGCIKFDINKVNVISLKPITMHMRKVRQ